MQATRRVFLQKYAVGGATFVALGSGLLRSAEVLAAWSEAAFQAETLDATMQALFAGETAQTTDAIRVKAPDIAENGAVVPISVQTDLPGVESITILAEKNPIPLVAKFNLTADAVADVSTRIKMGQTSNVMVVVKSEGKLFMTNQEVKVTIGGCGG